MDISNTEGQLSIMDISKKEEPLSKEEQLSKIEHIPANASIDKGALLEYRIKRLLFNMGYFTQNNIILKTMPQEPSDIITDLDAFGVRFATDFSCQTNWTDCKSGKADVLKHISWINGVKSKAEINSVIFIKNNVRKTAKEYAQTLGIKVCDTDMITQLEKCFEIDSEDWSGSYDYKLLKTLPDIFTKISVPDNRTYKNIFSYYTSTYWVMDPFTQVKKCISGIKQLNEFYSLPLGQEQKFSIKWMLLSLISLFILSTFKICGQLFYYDKHEKKEHILNGIMSGSIPIAKQNEIKSIAFRMATELITQKIPDFDSSTFNQVVKSTPPSYFEAYYDLVLRISENPTAWCDILRQLDYAMMEYELKGIQPTKGKEFNTQSKTCFKTILYFIIYSTGLPKEMFAILLE